MKNERCLATFDCGLFTDRLKEIVKTEYGAYYNKFAAYYLYETEDELIRIIENGSYIERSIKVEDKLQFVIKDSKLQEGLYDICINAKKDETEEKHIILRGLSIRERSKCVKFSINTKTILKKEEWTEDEWKTILKLFKFESADEVVLQPLVVTGYGNPEKGVVVNE